MEKVMEFEDTTEDQTLFMEILSGLHSYTSSATSKKELRSMMFVFFMDLQMIASITFQQWLLINQFNLLEENLLLKSKEVDFLKARKSAHSIPMRSRIHQSSIQAWEKPHVGFFKCNVNAAIL
ncbi:hypothetical protein H0E87_004006 [Populus deltoides]|uniref:Uncharacterized protein n=1 Tax=Populus deltoides TaxID=3696 RepID=A0A8T2ZDB7_POPDE|nr:hypothetical protein H0E87_004006 [Populus deltoides]